MKTLSFKQSALPICATAIIMLSGCTGNDLPETELQLDGNMIEASSAGGQFTIGYTVDNPGQDNLFPTAAPEEDWVNNFTYDEQNIRFEVDANLEKQERQTTVVVTYEGFDGECTFTVRQSAAGDLVFSSDKIDVPAEGGSFSMTYTVPEDDGNITVTASCAESWISEIDCSVKGTVSFKVTANKNPEERTAKITAKSSTGTDEASFDVIQKGFNSASGSSFEITIDEIRPAEITYSVIPEDKSMTYLSMTIAKSTFDGYGSEDEFFASEMEFHEMLASAAGLSIEEYLDQILMKGDQKSLKGEYLDPDTEYYAYAYGLNNSGEKLTPISKTVFTTEKLEHKDMTFEFEYTLAAASVDVMVLPNLTEDWYFFSAMRTEGLGENPDMKFVIEDYLNYVIEYYMMTQGGSIESALELVAYRGVGINSFDTINDMEYIIFAAAIDMSTGLVVSDVTEERFMSPKAESDNEISLETESIGFKNAGINISVTNEDPYVFCIDLAENWEGMTNEEMLAKLSEKDMSYFVRNGNFYAPIQDRQPGEEYRAFAFGYSSGIVTTPLTTITFKMHDIAESDIELSIEFDKYFSIDELKELYPDKFGSIPDSYNIIMPVWTSLKGSDTTGVKYYYSVYPGDWTSSSDVYSMAETLLNSGCPNRETNFYFVRDSYLQTHTYIGIAADKNGNFGPLFRLAFNMTDDGISPAEEYPLDKFTMNTPRQPQKGQNNSVLEFDISGISDTRSDHNLTDKPMSISNYVLSPEYMQHKRSNN